MNFADGLLYAEDAGIVDGIAARWCPPSWLWQWRREVLDVYTTHFFDSIGDAEQIVRMTPRRYSK